MIVILVNVLLSVLHEAVPQGDHELEHLLQICDVLRAVLHVEVPLLGDRANLREHLLHELLFELNQLYVVLPLLNTIPLLSNIYIHFNNFYSNRITSFAFRVVFATR